MEKKEIVEKIKSKLTDGYAMYLEGDYYKDRRCYLWWYVWMEDDVMWVEFEDSSSPGNKVQNAENFDAEMLESVFDSMTGIEEKLTSKN